MISEAAFLFSIAGLSVTLAGFSGLVAAFRRGSGWSAIDLFRLLEIAEFGLTNALLALVTIPLAIMVGDSTAFRIAGASILLYVCIHIGALLLRRRRLAIRLEVTHVITAGLIDVAIIVAAGATIAVGRAVAYEWLLLFLLARPMLAFVLVLRDLSRTDDPATLLTATSTRRSP